MLIGRGALCSAHAQTEPVRDPTPVQQIMGTWDDAYVLLHYQFHQNQ